VSLLRPKKKHEIMIKEFDEDSRTVTVVMDNHRLNDFAEFFTTIIVKSRSVHEVTIDDRYDFLEVLEYLKSQD
jgi:hypothetical protein